jgi:hypothetical protein
MFKHASTALVVTLALAACGDDERLTQQQLSAKATPQVERVMAGFGAVFSTIGRAEESDRVPAEAIAKVREAAATETSATEALAALEPPEAAEPALDRFVAAARKQAARLRTLGEQPAVTVKEVADAIEDPATRDALAALAEKGYVKVAPPGGS